MRLSIQAKGADGRRMDLIGDRVNDPTPLFSMLADDLFQAEAKLFQTGRGWAPLKPETIKRKARLGQDLRPLHATGRLEETLTRRGTPGQLLSITRKELQVGIPSGPTPVFYGRFQARYGRNPIVSRRIVSKLAKPKIKAWLVGE